jgi:hypothetical protein
VALPPELTEKKFGVRRGGGKGRANEAQEEAGGAGREDGREVARRGGWSRERGLAVFSFVFLFFFYALVHAYVMSGAAQLVLQLYSTPSRACQGPDVRFRHLKTVSRTVSPTRARAILNVINIEKRGGDGGCPVGAGRRRHQDKAAESKDGDPHPI